MPKKGDTSSKKDFKVGDEVFILNPRAIRQKVAVGTVSGFHGSHKFHGKEIASSWLKVDVRKALQVGIPLMFPTKKQAWSS